MGILNYSPHLGWKKDVGPNYGQEREKLGT